MSSLTPGTTGRALFIFVFILIIFYFVFLQFISPCLYEVDGYYNAAIANIIKTEGIHFKFHWAQFSTFKDSYGDTQFLFHLSIIPFLYITRDIILAGKFCVIFYNLLFFITLAFIMRKYLPDFLTACFLVFPLLSPAFTFYFLRLRAVTLAVMLTILCIYCIINKKRKGLLILSFLYALSHPSFFTILIFAVFCEFLRRFKDKEFFSGNIYAAAVGSFAGCVLNPYFPNNVFCTFLNGILIPAYSIMNKGIIFAQEVRTQSAELIFMTNFAVFFTLIIILWIAFINRPKVSFSTMAWWACASFYLLISFKGDRFWYPTNILFFIFFASFLKDYIGRRDWKEVSRNTGKMCVAYSVIILACLPYNIQLMKNTIIVDVLNNLHYEKVALWMKGHLPKGERVYHANGSDASYFLCLNTGNDYLVFCDPVYMFWRYPEEYAAYIKLRQGKMDRPGEALKNIFKTRYGYTRKENPLYRQIADGKSGFRVMYEDGIGVVFEV